MTTCIVNDILLIDTGVRASLSVGHDDGHVHEHESPRNRAVRLVVPAKDEEARWNRSTFRWKLEVKNMYPRLTTRLMDKDFGLGQVINIYEIPVVRKVLRIMDKELETKKDAKQLGRFEINDEGEQKLCRRTTCMKSI